MQKATTLPSRKVAYFDESESVQMRLHKSLKLWSMYADLEESFGTFKVRIISRRNDVITNVTVSESKEEMRMVEYMLL